MPLNLFNKQLVEVTYNMKENISKGLFQGNNGATSSNAVEFVPHEIFSTDKYFELETK